MVEVESLERLALEGGRPKREFLYFALLLTVGRVGVREVRGDRGEVYVFHRLHLEDGGFFRLPRLHRGRPVSEFLGVRVWAHFAPRTDARGLLGKTLPLRRLRPAGEETLERPLLRARGRVAFVDPEEGRFGLLVRPNPGGRLKEPFTLTLWAPLSLLEELPLVGSAVYLEGELRPKSGRLVVRRWEPARLWDDPQ